MKLKYIKPTLPLCGISENPAARRPERGLGKVLTIFYLILFHFIFMLSSLTAAEYGKTILALYKTSDGFSESNNPIKSYLDTEIKKFGLKIEYRSFESGMPSKDSLNDIRAVISWYNGGVVQDKKTGLDYIEFLKSAIDSECKLIIINSFGAYGYKEGGSEKWDLINDINSIYKKMGFYFKGYWTNDASKLRIAGKESYIVEKEAGQDVKISKHYQQIIPLRKDVETYLTVKRTDNVPGLGDGNSSVILTSKNGGFALESYVMSGSRLMLNVPEFVRKALFFDDGIQDVCVIPGNIKNKSFVVNDLNYAFKYAKIKNTFIDPENLTSMIAEDLFPFNVIIIAADSLENIPFNPLREYVNKGGRLIFAKSADLTNQFKELIGVKKYGNVGTFTEGFSFNPDFFINHVPVKAEGIAVAVRKALLSNCKVLASVLDKDERKNYPVLWEKTFGKGKILYWNTDLLLNNDKGFRGTIVQSIHYIYSGFITGTANIGMMMIDDLPAPLWNMNYRKYRIEYYNNQLKTESDKATQKKLKTIIGNLQNYSSITDTNFIDDLWIKDIESFEKTLGFKYSTYLIFNYNNKTVLSNNKDTFPIHDFYLAENNIPVKMGSRILRNGWELGFHGYNHQSLTVTKPEHYASLPWTDRNTMINALYAAKKEWIAIFGEASLPFSYVAPHNIIDNAGLSALAEVFPSIQVISTLYVSDQGEIEQEFEWTKDRRFFQIPRISSGYIIKPSNKYFIYDTIHNFGVVSHFVHPDDVFDEHRSSGYAGWNAMKASFVADFSEIKKYYPALRWMTSKDAFDEFRFYNSANISVKESGKTIIVESSDGSERYLYFRLRLNKGQKIKSVQNCQIVNADKKSGDVILKTTEYLSKIVLN
ncbi:MAG: DUF2194 domain-containing protein [Spirochaetes bacterium]|nr:DUF2194 domain-containing protein [Spirochaetota bacterium]